MADEANLNLYQGDDYSAQVTVSAAGGGDADLTGYTAQAQIRASPADAALAAQFVTSIEDNVVTLTLDHDATKALARPSYVWDLQLIDVNGWITTILAGQVEVTREVTKVYAAV